jgi:Tetratricopeptide repeat
VGSCHAQKAGAVLGRGRVTAAGVEGWAAQVGVSALVAHGWSEFLRPPSRRRLVVSRRMTLALVLLSFACAAGWTLALTKPPREVGLALSATVVVLIVGSIVAAFRFLRFPSLAFARAERLAGQGDVQGARTAYQRLIDAGHADAAPMAALNLGLLLEQHGDTEGARAAYRLAIQSKHPEVSAHASFRVRALDSDKHRD